MGTNSIMRQAVSKAKITIFGLTILLLLFVGIQCSMRTREIVKDLKPHTLEFKDVFNYKLYLNPNTKVPEKIFGDCSASAYCVQGITTRTNGTTLTMFVTIGLCKEDNQVGGFSYPLEIATNITELRFGNNGHLLWKRQQPK